MRRGMLLLAVGAVAMMSLGCVGFTLAPLMPPPAFVVTIHTAPLSTNFDKSPVGARKGSATVTNILGIVSLGDCGINAAAKDGGVNSINYADYSIVNILGMFNTTTVTVYGD